MGKDSLGAYLVCINFLKTHNVEDEAKSVFYAF